MINFEIKGLDKIQKELDRIASDVPRLVKKEFLQQAETIVVDAQLLCADPKLRESIRYEIDSTGENISICFFCDDDAKVYLEQSFEENEENISIHIKQALQKALRGK